jgi:hypothetical protein
MDCMSNLELSALATRRRLLSLLVLPILIGLVGCSKGTGAGVSRSSVDIDHGFTVALFNLAILRTLAGDPGEAVALYRKLIKLKQSRGSLDEATAELTRAIQLDSALVKQLMGIDHLGG